MQAADLNQVRITPAIALSFSSQTVLSLRCNIKWSLYVTPGSVTFRLSI